MDIVKVDGKARGIIARDLVTGKLERHSAHAVVIASGGYGNVFFLSTNAMGSNVSEAFSVSGVNASSIVTASFKSGDNGRYIKTVTPSSNTITITLDGAASGGVIMYIIIN